MLFDLESISVGQSAIMVPKISEVSAAKHGSRADDADPATTSGDEDVSIVTAELRARSRRQLRFWLVAANVVAWILIILAIRAIFF
jgi:hypothetical protein